MSEMLKVPARAYATIYMQRRYGVAGLLYALLIVAGIVAGFGDVRWAIVTLMAIFILTPMALTMAWLTVMGRRDLPMRLHPFMARADADNLTISYYAFDYDDDSRPIMVIVLRAKDISGIARDGKFIRLDLNPGADFDFLLLPRSVELPGNFLELI